jgi:hypothetical protein
MVGVDLRPRRAEPNRGCQPVGNWLRSTTAHLNDLSWQTNEVTSIGTLNLAGLPEMNEIRLVATHSLTSKITTIVCFIIEFTGT